MPTKRQTLKLKKIIKLKLNFHNRLKLILLRKSKWQKFLELYTAKLKNNSNLKYLLHDQNLFYVPKFNNLLTKNLKTLLFFKQQIKSFYGNLLKRYLKTRVKIFLKSQNALYENFKNSSLFFATIFSKRLDFLLHKAKFFLTLFNAKQAINHGKICINSNHVNINSYMIKKGDFVQVNSKISSLIKNFIFCFDIWPVIPKNLKVNYKILSINYLQNSTIISNFIDFPNWFNFRSIIKMYR